MFLGPAASTFGSLSSLSPRHSGLFGSPASSDYNDYEMFDFHSSLPTPERTSLPNFGSNTLEGSFRFGPGSSKSSPLTVLVDHELGMLAAGAGNTGHSRDASDCEGGSGADVDTDSARLGSPLHPSISDVSIVGDGSASHLSASVQPNDASDTDMEPFTSLAAHSDAYHADSSVGYAYAAIEACAARKADVWSASFGTLFPLFTALDSVIDSAKASRVRFDAMMGGGGVYSADLAENKNLLSHGHDWCLCIYLFLGRSGRYYARPVWNVIQPR